MNKSDAMKKTLEYLNYRCVVCDANDNNKISLSS